MPGFSAADVAARKSPIPPIDRQRTAGRPAAAKKSLGQHFLVDRRVLGRIVAAAEVSPGDLVLEIGPGRGILTRELAKRAARVVAIEMDDALAARLADEFRGQPHVTVVAADARQIDLDSVVPSDARYKMVANLPYYAASPIIRRFLEAMHKPELMVVMVQREVARSMAAAPGKMGLLSVGVQLYGRPRIVSYAPPRAFRPAPKVTSAVVRIDVYPEPVLPLDSEKRFFALVRAGFSSPRKQIRNSLRNGLSISAEAAESMLSLADIDPRRRAETLALAEWGSLYDAFRSEPLTPLADSERLGQEEG